MNEEKREQLLKRILPGLAITIIYFVFISNMVGEKMKKAETEYKGLLSMGISKDALPGTISQQQQLQQQLTELESKVTKNKAELKKLAGFLAHSESTNATTTKLSDILAKHQIYVLHDAQETMPPKQLSSALYEIWQGLASESKTEKTATTPKTDTTTKTISVYHLWLTGSYYNMYQALNAIAEAKKLSALPISLTMTMPETEHEKSNELEWELILWM